MVRYSANAARALAYLKRFYNDIEIFIEDITSHNKALFVFKRVLGERVKLTSVNQLGGRAHVLNACKLDQQDDGRKKIYIIDADFDLLTGRRKPKLKYLYRLRAYCVENLLISNCAIVELASEIESNTPPDQLDLRLKHRSWLSENSESLKSLFVAYGVSAKLELNIPSISFNVHRLCVRTTGGAEILSASKIRSRMRSFCRQCIAVIGLPAFRAERARIAGRVTGFPNPDHMISGKDYLLPLLQARLRSEIKFTGGIDELRVRLARHYEVGQEPFLARRLRSVAGGD